FKRKVTKMSHQLSNLQKSIVKFSLQIYQVTVHDEKHSVPQTTSSSCNQLIGIPGTFNCFILLQPSCAYTTNQPAQHRNNDFVSWRQSASIDDWKAYLYSAPETPAVTQTSTRTVNRINSPSRHNGIPQTQMELLIIIVSLQRQLLNHQMTPFMYNVDSTRNNALNYDNIYVLLSDHQSLQRGYKQAIQNANHNAAIKTAIQNRRNCAGRLRANNMDTSLNYYRSGWNEQKKIRNGPNFYSPELIRYIDPSIYEREWKRAGLAYVESLLDNADVYGYVTIDTRAMQTLVTIIDNVLPQNLDLN
ncbi:hypothetical protein ACJJTC_009959, partial [Scirpophaga incertulas]